MNDAVLAPTIAKFITDTFLFEFDDAVTPDTNLFEAGLIDSFGFTQLIAFLEETYGVTLTEDELTSEDIASLNGLEKIVKRLQATPQPTTGLP